MGLHDGHESFLDGAFRRRQVDADLADPPPDAEAAVPPGDEPAESAVDVVEAAEAADTPPESDVVEAAEPPPSPLTRFDRALVDEAMKKAGLIWVRTRLSPGGRALWYVWTGGNAYVLTGGDEQPDPGLDDEQVVVVVRSKDTTSRLLAMTCRPSQVSGDDEDWDLVTAELAKARLNLRGAEVAPQRWRDEPAYRIFRLSPTDEALVEGPGDHPLASGRAAPVATPATTAGARPWVLHRRGGSGRPLS